MDTNDKMFRLYKILCVLLLCTILYYFIGPVWLRVKVRKRVIEEVMIISFET